MTEDKGGLARVEPNGAGSYIVIILDIGCGEYELMRDATEDANKINAAVRAKVREFAEKAAERAERYGREHSGVWGNQTASKEIAAEIRKLAEDFQ